MDTFEEHLGIALSITLRITEKEARFLHGLAGYEHEAIHEILSTHLGKAYTEEYVDGLYSLLQTAQKFGNIIRKVDEARKRFLEA